LLVVAILLSLLAAVIYKRLFLKEFLLFLLFLWFLLIPFVIHPILFFFFLLILPLSFHLLLLLIKPTHQPIHLHKRNFFAGFLRNTSTFSWKHHLPLLNKLHYTLEHSTRKLLNLNLNILHAILLFILLDLDVDFYYFLIILFTHLQISSQIVFRFSVFLHGLITRFWMATATARHTRWTTILVLVLANVRRSNFSFILFKINRSFFKTVKKRLLIFRVVHKIR